MEQVGTPPYLAPEQIQGQASGPWTDQFGLAVVVYEWLSGRRPFAGDTPEEILVKQSQPAAPLHVFFRDLPVGASRAISALSRDPRDRFPTCTAFVTEILTSVEAPVVSETLTPRPLKSGPLSAPKVVPTLPRGRTNPGEDMDFGPVADPETLVGAGNLEADVRMEAEKLPASGTDRPVAGLPPLPVKSIPLAKSPSAPASKPPTDSVPTPTWSSHRQNTNQPGQVLALIARICRWVVLLMVLFMVVIIAWRFLQPLVAPREPHGGSLTKKVVADEPRPEKPRPANPPTGQNHPVEDQARLKAIERQNQKLTEQLESKGQDLDKTRRALEAERKNNEDLANRLAAEKDRIKKLEDAVRDWARARSRTPPPCP